jgi:hypothetical protein
LNHLSFVCITALADDTRRVELHKVEGLGHVLGMLIAYFLKEKIVVVIPLASGATSMITWILDFLAITAAVGTSPNRRLSSKCDPEPLSSR